MLARIRIIPVLVLATLSLLFVFCTKSEIDCFKYRFASAGGVKEYTAMIDGSSFSLSSRGVEAKKPDFYEDITNDANSQWFTELDWIRVYYTPSKESILISVDSNPSGLDRNAVITGFDLQGRKKIVIDVRQEK